MVIFWSLQNGRLDMLDIEVAEYCPLNESNHFNSAYSSLSDTRISTLVWDWERLINEPANPKVSLNFYLVSFEML